MLHYLFLTVYLTLFLHSFIVCHQVFAAEQPMFLRDHFNGMYRTDVYVVAKMMADLPFQLLYSFLFIAIPYYPIGFHPDVPRFLTAVAILVIVANVATSFGKKTSLRPDMFGSLNMYFQQVISYHVWPLRPRSLQPSRPP